MADFAEDLAALTTDPQIAEYRAECSRLLTENAQLRVAGARADDRLTAAIAALADIAGINPLPDGGVLVTGECVSFDRRCHERDPEDPVEWCPVCVAEVAWTTLTCGELDR